MQLLCALAHGRAVVRRFGRHVVVHLLKEQTVVMLIQCFMLTLAIRVLRRDTKWAL